MSTSYSNFDQSLAGPLGPDERIIWQGKPYPGLLFSGPGLAPPWFGWMFFLFSLFWIGMASRSISEQGFEGLAFTAFGVPFVVIGFYMAIGQYPWDAHVRRQTTYSLTNKRAIISSSGLRGRTLNSYPITSDTQLEFVALAGGSVWFAKSITTGRNGTTTSPIGFVGIQDAQDVYKKMLEQQQSAK